MQDIAALADDEAKYTHELETLNAKKNETAERHSAALAEEQEIVDKVEALKVDEEKQCSEVAPLKKDLVACEEGIKKNKRDMDHYSAKKKEYLDKANSFNNAINEARAELEKNSSTAAKIHGDRVESRRDTAKLKQELTVLKTKLDKLTGTVEPKEIVAENFNKFTKVILYLMNIK
jgi:chromosome segregation ATPase